jgi:hypothetical protein
MKKVSFDFDHTLSQPEVQEFAKELLDNGIDVWVVTTRYDENHLHKYAMDYPATLEDLWEVVERLGIPRWKVRFTNMEWKYTYLCDTEFLWHLDDNNHEIRRALYNKCKVPMIQVADSNFKNECLNLINNHEGKL